MLLREKRPSVSPLEESASSGMSPSSDFPRFSEDLFWRLLNVDRSVLCIGYKPNASAALVFGEYARVR